LFLVYYITRIASTRKLPPAKAGKLTTKEQAKALWLSSHSHFLQLECFAISLDV